MHTGGAPVKYDENGNIAIKSQPKESRTIDGIDYVLEYAIKSDFAFVKAYKADKLGNLQFRKSTMNFNSPMAMAAKTTIVEAEHLTDYLEPDEIHLPAIFVDRLVKGENFEKRIEKVKLAEGPGSKELSKEEAVRFKIARRAAQEFKDGMYVNLGIGIPVLAAAVRSPGINVYLHSENGVLGMGPYPESREQCDPDLINAAKETITVIKGASYFPSDLSFAIVRGGHLDLTMLGAMQVSKYGDLANWMIPKKLIKGPGGAFDLVSSKDTKVVVCMEHNSKKGENKILDECELPLTGSRVVNRVVTEKAVFDVDPLEGLTLVEIAGDLTLDQLKACTGCEFSVSSALKTIDI